MATWLHAFVQHTDDLDHARRVHAIIKNMHRRSYRSFDISTHMTNMKAADASKKIVARAGGRILRFRCNLAHRGGKQPCIATLRVSTPPFRAGGQDLSNIGLRQL